MEAERALEASVALLSTDSVLGLLDRHLRVDCVRRQVE
jgi:hypothetical protein